MPIESTDSVAAAQPRRFPWRVFWFLLVLSIAAVAAAMPLIFEVFLPLIESAPAPALPLPLIIVAGIAQNSILLAVLIGVGLRLAGKLGLGAPILKSWLYHEKPEVSVRDALKYGALFGIAVGVVLLVPLLIAAHYLPGLPFVSAARAAVWKRFLTCFYGGIVEEILMRLFLLTLIGWLGTRFIQKQKMRMSLATFWSANVAVAILFGLGHLPNAAMVMEITPAVVALALALNGIAGVAFGYLYWKRGLESAIVAHFCADFVIYVIGPAFLRT